jgi:protein-disulfide isomerase
MLDGVSNQEFNECIEDKKIQQKILNEFIELKNAIHLESAPTFFINQQQLVGYSDYLTIKQAIEKELDSAK